MGELQPPCRDEGRVARRRHIAQLDHEVGLVAFVHAHVEDRLGGAGDLHRILDRLGGIGEGENVLGRLVLRVAEAQRHRVPQDRVGTEGRVGPVGPAAAPVRNLPVQSVPAEKQGGVPGSGGGPGFFILPVTLAPLTGLDVEGDRRLVLDPVGLVA